MARVDKLLASLKKLKLSLAEATYIFLFVLNFALGKLLHVFSQKEEVYNYYNDKGNIFNQWFVKKGWGWTTAVIVLFYSVELSRQPNTKVAAKAVVRYVVATVWWILFTQWCFGHPIMDKVFLLTGGKCSNIDESRLARFSINASTTLIQLIDGNYESRQISSASCRRLKGTWEGGHDPSGHVFLLVHSSLYLFHEIKPFWPGWTKFFKNIQISVRASSKNTTERLLDVLKTSPQVAVVLLLSLWWFMLLMTNMYFHSLAEKLVGLIFGYVAVIAVYYVPRWINKLENVDSGSGKVNPELKKVE